MVTEHRDDMACTPIEGHDDPIPYILTEPIEWVAIEDIKQAALERTFTHERTC